MALRKCEQCDATVAADEQFCPNCGAFMDPMTNRPHSNVISVSSSGFETFELSEPPPPPEKSRRKPQGDQQSQQELHCPSCGAPNPPSNRHCEECGARLSQAPLPTAPRPAVQASAGVRAALAISGILFGVVIVALLFNVLGGDGGGESTTTIAQTTTTSQQAQQNGPITVISETCSVDGISSFVCANLTDGTDASYQVNWEELGEETINIRLTFDQPMVISQILWAGLTDPVRFTQNYRARGLIIEASDSVSPVNHELTDTPGEQAITYAAVGANWVEFEIVSAWTATLTEGNVFREIAIQEITVIGRPQGTITSGSSSTSSSTTAP